MKLAFILLALVATASAIAVPTGAPAMKPSASAFKPQYKAPLTLRGGGDFPIDAPTALKINAVIYAAFGALCFPDLNLPLIDFTLKKHDTRASLFYNDMSPETPILTKANRWIGASFFNIAALSYVVATEGSASLQKTVCKIGTVVCIFNTLMMLVNKQPVSCGGPIIAPLCGVILAMNA